MDGSALVAVTVVVAESKPEEKEAAVTLAVNSLV